MNNLTKSLPCGTRVRRKLYKVACHSCDIHGTWKSRGWGEFLKSSFRGQVEKGEQVFMGVADPSRHHETLL